MEYGRAFTFVTEDEHWLKKLIIGAIFTLIGILFFFIYGYQVAIVRNVIEGEEQPLPEWDDWGKLFLDGLKIIVGILLYTLPIILLSICMTVVLALTSESAGNADTAMMVAVIAVSCLTIILSLVIALLVPAITIQYARSGEFGAMFQVAKIVAITRDNLVQVILVMLLLGVAGFVVFLLGLIPCIGWFIIWPAGFAWINMTTGHLYGQIGKNQALNAAL